jgi:hypothetical protein
VKRVWAPCSPVRERERGREREGERERGREREREREGERVACTRISFFLTLYLSDW